jgi:hypothetical protein
MSDSWSPQNVDQAEEWLDSWVARVDAQAETAAQLARRVAAVSAVARSDDESIVVTVGANGQIENLELDDRVQRLSGRELSGQILAVMRTAQRQVARSVAAEVQATVGEDSETGRAVVDAFDRRFPEPPAQVPHER